MLMTRLLQQRKRGMREGKKNFESFIIVALTRHNDLSFVLIELEYILRVSFCIAKLALYIFVLFNFNR